MKVLVVVDMQNDFVDGALGTKEAQGILGRVKRKINRYKQAGEMIIYTKDTHGEGYLSSQEGRNLPVEHGIKGTPGWDIAPGLYVEGSPVIEKPAFGSLELAELVAGVEGLESVELVGVCTDICVISNALILKARLPEVPIAVDASCCAGITPESHSNALAAMKMCQVQING